MHCLSPWIEMSLHCSGYGKVGCCAFSGRPFKFQEPYNILDLWNNIYFQKLRFAIANKQLDDTGCERCKFAFNDDRNINIENCNKRQIENYKKIMDEYKHKKLILEGYPLMYQFNFNSSCNLKCIMCNQADIRDIHVFDEKLSAECLLQNKEILSHAITIRISGGEPLCSSECKKFMKTLCIDKDLVDVELDLTTNGLLLEKVFDYFVYKDKISISISMDGIGKVYEYIRKGAKWEKINSVIDKLINLKQKYNKKWKISSVFILMKSNLPILVDYILYCLEKKIEPKFLLLSPTRDTYQEDLINNPTLLNEVKNWEIIIKDSVDILKNKNFHSQANSLERFKEILLNSLHSGKDNNDCMIYFGEGFSNIELIYGKKTVIWGVGSNYKYCLSQWLKDNLNKIKFIGFVSSWKEHWGKKCDGFPIFRPEELLKLKPEVIIIAAQQVYRISILEKIKTIGLKDVTII